MFSASLTEQFCAVKGVEDSLTIRQHEDRQESAQELGEVMARSIRGIPPLLEGQSLRGPRRPHCFCKS